jgi:hypothetical protein
LILIVGVLLELNLNGVPVVARGEPRPAILAFLLATLWLVVHIEWMVLSHQRTMEKSSAADDAARCGGNLSGAIRFRGRDRANTTHVEKQFRRPVLLRSGLAGLLLISFALFAVGSTLDLVRFTTTLAGDEAGCVRSINLFTFPNIAVSGLVLDRNESVYGIWILVVSFLVFVLVIPWFVHVVHALAIWWGFKSKVLFRVADAGWTFSCVEVFLIALYVIEIRTGLMFCFVFLALFVEHRAELTQCVAIMYQTLYCSTSLNSWSINWPVTKERRCSKYRPSSVRVFSS